MSKTKIMLTLFSFTLASLMAYAKTQDAKLVESVKNNTSELHCYINSYHTATKIDPGKVKSFSDGIWTFENGSSKSCFIKEAL